MSRLQAGVSLTVRARVADDARPCRIARKNSESTGGQFEQPQKAAVEELSQAPRPCSSVDAMMEGWQDLWSPSLQL